MTTLNFALTRTAARELEGRRRDRLHDARPRRQRLAVARARARPRSRRQLRRDRRRMPARPRPPAQSLLYDRTRVVAFPYASNAVGTITPVAEIAALAHEAGALAWVDAVHYGPHGPIDVQAIGADVLVCSPYKYYGPHMGLAFGRRASCSSRWRPYKVRPASNDPVGRRFETGTSQHELLAGLRRRRRAHAVDWAGTSSSSTSTRSVSGSSTGCPTLRRSTGCPTMDRRVPTFAFNVAGRRAAGSRGAAGRRRLRGLARATTTRSRS